MSGSSEKGNNFLRFVHGAPKKKLSVYSEEDMLEELETRKAQLNPFPLDVFNPNVKPFITALREEYDMPAAYIGTCLLAVYSSAIGTSYAVTSNRVDKVFLSVWASMWGISSSGKSFTFSKIFEPLLEKQKELDAEWRRAIRGMTYDAIENTPMPTLVYRDSHIATLVRSVLPDNPKGVTKFSDELLEWINGMNQLSRKEGTDEQFWLSTWNCSPYTAIRSGKQKFIIERPFVNVLGGVQSKILWKFFANDRDTTGFAFRLLFGRAEHNRLPKINKKYVMPLQVSWPHKLSLNVLWERLPVTLIDGEFEEPRLCVLTHQAIDVFDKWENEQIDRINSMSDEDEMNLQAGIFGKIKEYALRFSAILALVDIALDNQWSSVDDGLETRDRFTQEVPVTREHMERSLKLCQYYYVSAQQAHEFVRASSHVPYEVLLCANLHKRGFSFAKIGHIMYGTGDSATKSKVARNIKKWIRDFPKVFNAEVK